MRERSFRKSIFVSLLGHLAVFGIFSLSFGALIPRANFPAVSFWGAILGNSQVAMPSRAAQETAFKSRPFIAKSQIQKLNKAPSVNTRLQGYYLKPPLVSSSQKEKKFPILSPRVLRQPPVRKEPMILLHPLLPYKFSLYFKDRQVAHVEVMFNIERRGSGNSIAVKRKISSGNLEADLLCMRYIGHYLFIEQERFTPNSWQTVKIDLSKATTDGMK